MSRHGRLPRKSNRHHNARSIGKQVSASGLAPRAQGCIRSGEAVPEAYNDRHHRAGRKKTAEFMGKTRFYREQMSSIMV